MTTGPKPASSCPRARFLSRRGVDPNERSLVFRAFARASDTASHATNIHPAGESACGLASLTMEAKLSNLADNFLSSDHHFCGGML